MSYNKIPLFALIFCSTSMFYTQINAMYTVTQSIEKNLLSLDRIVEKLQIRTSQTWAVKGICNEYMEVEKILRQHESRRDNFKNRFNESKRLDSLPLLKDLDYEINGYMIGKPSAW